MVMGAARYMGSNVLEESCNISHLMTRVVLAGIIFLGARELISICIPKYTKHVSGIVFISNLTLQI